MNSDPLTFMEDLASPSLMPGPSQSPLRRPVESRSRKSALHNIFQGVNLRQLRRLFHAAGEQDAEQHAKLVWGKGSQEASEADGENEDSLAEVESGLAQALVGLRVRARTRNGLRAEMRDGGSGTRLVKAFGHVRLNEGSSSSVNYLHDVDSEQGACGGLDETKTDEAAPIKLPWTRNGSGEKDPERYLHRIRH